MTEDQSMQPIAEEEIQVESVIETEETTPADSEIVEVIQPRFVVKRAGVETDIVFPFACPAVVGRFDATVGPIDIDFGSIEEGSYVSRKHAKITEEEGVFTISDLGSSNGTYVANDGEFQKVESATIESGQEIAFGNARVVFYV